MRCRCRLWVFFQNLCKFSFFKILSLFDYKMIIPRLLWKVKKILKKLKKYIKIKPFREIACGLATASKNKALQVM
nr:MAG TPA: hypothetical protein [Bacteriophage sp.]